MQHACPEYYTTALLPISYHLDACALLPRNCCYFPSWFHHLDPSLREEPWTEIEDQILRDAQLRLGGDRWAEIAKLLTGRTESSVKSHWHATFQKKNAPQGGSSEGLDAGMGDIDDDGGDGEIGGGSATPRPGGGNDDEGDYGSFALDVVPGGGGGGGVCSPVGRVGGPESPLPPAAQKMLGVAGSSAAHVGPCAPAAPAIEAGASPAVVPLSSFPLGASSASSVEGLGRWQVRVQTYCFGGGF